MTTAQTWALSLSERLKRDCEMNWPDYDNQMAASVELSRLAAVEAELAAAKAQVEALSTLSVTNIMLDVVPGDDGEGCEVFAKSVAEVEEALGRLGLEVEDWRCGIKRLQPSLTRPAVPEGWKLVPKKVTALMAKRAADAWLDCGSRLVLNKAAAAVAAGIAIAPTPERAEVMEFDAWWNSSAADNFRARYENMDGEIFRPVWNAAIRATAPQPD